MVGEQALLFKLPTPRSMSRCWNTLALAHLPTTY